MDYLPSLLEPDITLAPQSVELVHIDAARFPGSYAGYRILRIIQYKEKTLIGHEFLVIDVIKEQEAEKGPSSSRLLRQETAVLRFRVERRPSTRNVKLSSSEALTDDTITPVPSDAFRPEDYYHIATVRCTNPPTTLSILGFCQICKTIRDAAPMYSLFKARHCFWYCVAFIAQLRIEGYANNVAKGMHHYRKGKVLRVVTPLPAIRDEIIEKELLERSNNNYNHLIYPSSQSHNFLVRAVSRVLKSVGVAYPRHATSWHEVNVLRGHQKAVLSVAFTRDNRIISGSRDTNVGVWDLTTGCILRYLRGHKAEVTSVAVSPRGPNLGYRVVSGSCDNTIRIWDADALVVLRVLEAHTQDIISVCLSSDGSKIVSASEDQTLRLWDLEMETPSGQPLMQGTIFTSVAWSNDGSLLAVGSSDTNDVQVLEVLDTATPTARIHATASLEGHEWSITYLAFSPCKDSGYLVSVSRDATLRVWDARTGKPIGKPFQGHTGSVCSAAFSHDGRYLVSGSYDNSIRVWDVEEGLPVCTLQGHVDDVDSVAFSPDGYTIVSGSTDKTIRVWTAAGPV